MSEGKPVGELLGETEDRLIEAERTIDSYREEVARITDQRNRCSETADRLRALLDRATVVIACYADRVAFANELRAEAGLEPLAPLGDESRRDALDAQTLHDSPGADL